MASDVGNMPFVKQLAAGDRPTREAALESLQTYLCSGRTFTQTELLKIWKGLFFCIHHTDRPLPQQRLSLSLSHLLLALPAHIFLPYLSAFWTTMISFYSSIPSLRLDKYLYLIRLYVAASFTYLARSKWSSDLVHGWTALMEGRNAETTDDPSGPQGCSVLDVEDAKVPDGLRYHVLDVWVDGLVESEGYEERVDVLVAPVERVAKEGSTKVLKQRAKAALGDERLQEGGMASEGGDGMDEAGDEDEFEGFD